MVPCILLRPSRPRPDRTILLPDQGDVEHHGQDARARGPQADGVPPVIFRRVLDEEGEGGDEAPGVAEADDPGGADVAVGGAGAGKVEVHDVPADDDGAGGKGAHGDEADGQILDGKGVVDGEEDGEAGGGEYGPENDEGGAEPRVVGRVRRDEAEGQSGGDGGHGVQLGLHGRVAERFDYGWGEVGKGFL